MKKLVDILRTEHHLDNSAYKALLENDDSKFVTYLHEQAHEVTNKMFGKGIFVRGLIELTNVCSNDCYYCGIRKSNSNVERYVLTTEQVLHSCQQGYELGFRTFVLQGGELPQEKASWLINLVSEIRQRWTDCAITLSLGEWPREVYKALRQAGADRYLLRHETADREHYEMLHPAEMSFEHRMQCLKDLKDIGYQVGCGMMVGSPYQTTEHLVKDLRFLKEFRPEMVGIGPFIPHHDTQFAEHEAGTVDMTLRLLSVIRLLLPDVLLPATTALGTIDPRGREKGILAGANVVMPNLSPSDVRGKYLLYDNKICIGDEAAECIRCMAMRISSVGYETVVARGDHVSFGIE